MMQLNDINPLTLSSLPLEKRSQLPAVAGIYFVLNKNKQVQYIGRSVNIRRRWSGHHQLALAVEDDCLGIPVKQQTLLSNLGKPTL